jgi:hypothetical protein
MQAGKELGQEDTPRILEFFILPDSLNSTANGLLIFDAQTNLLFAVFKMSLSSSRVWGGEETGDAFGPPSPTTDGTAVGPSTGEYQPLDTAKGGGSDEGASDELFTRNDVDSKTDDDQPVEQQNTHVTAEAWIREFDRLHPVPDTDSDLQRFEQLTRILITRLCQEAKSGDIANWNLLKVVERECTN